MNRLTDHKTMLRVTCEQVQKIRDEILLIADQVDDENGDELMLIRARLGGVMDVAEANLDNRSIGRAAS